MSIQCNEVESLLIDYIDAQLSPAARANVEKHLEGCIECRRTLEEYRTLFHAMDDTKMERPGPALREKFEIMLQSELNIDATSRIIKEETDTKVMAMKRPSLFLRIAASIILIAGGVLIGTQLMRPQPITNSSEIAGLKTEVKEIKEALMFNLLNDESATERIKAVNYAEQLDNGNPDLKIINALFNTMNRDKNVNVRLAALYSIAKFTTSQIVRDSLVASLRQQTEPIMQIVLINILTEKKESRAIGPIRELLSDKKTLKPVKDIARKGLQLL